MKTWRVVSGIVSIALMFFVVFQSCAAGLSNALEESGEVSGSAGVLLAILMLVGGILSLVLRNKSGKPIISIVIVYVLAALFGYTMAGSFTDLKIWATWCLVCAVIAVISMVKKKEKAPSGE
jgi:hypothetical protein